MSTVNGDLRISSLHLNTWYNCSVALARAFVTRKRIVGPRDLGFRMNLSCPEVPVSISTIQHLAAHIPRLDSLRIDTRLPLELAGLIRAV